MNWIGGARNRVKFNGEHSIQQEFFQKKRLGPKIAAAKLNIQKKPRLSQDLLALNSISKVHSQLYAGQPSSKPIKSVDLGKYRSCTQQINEVDMGPASPGQTPSRILLNEGTTEQKQSHRPARKRHDSHSSHKSTMGQDVPKKLHRSKGELDSHRDSGFSFSDSSTLGYSKDSFITRDRDSESDQSKTMVDQKINKPHHASESVKPSSDHPVHPTSQSNMNYNRVMNAYQKGSFLHPRGSSYDNALISEDFQATPLVNYDLVKSKSKDKHRHKHKSKSRMHISDQTINETLGSGFKDVPFQFSSTPLCSTVNEDYIGRDQLSSGHSSVIQLSPIMKMPLCDKSKFIYKSRLTATTTSVDENSRTRPHESQRTATGTCGHSDSARHQYIATQLCSQDQYRTTKPCSQDQYRAAQPCSQEQYRATKPCSQERLNNSGHSSVFEKHSPLSSSINSFDHSFHKRQFVTPSSHHVPMYATDEAVEKTVTEEASNSSLLHFRRYNINHSFSGSEKINTSLSAAGIEKPVFSDSDDDILYKPHKLSGPKRLYEKRSKPESNTPVSDTSEKQEQRKKVKRDQEDIKDKGIDEINSQGILNNQENHELEEDAERSTSFAPRASQLEVLNEISQLEHEDTEVHDATISQPPQIDHEAPSGGVCDEADMFIQSEALLMTELEKDLEETTTVKVSGDTSNVDHKNDHNDEKAQNQETDQCNNNNMTCNKTTEKACDMQLMKVDSQNDELKETDEFDISGDTIKSPCDAALRETPENYKQHTEPIGEVMVMNDTSENYKKYTGQCIEDGANNGTSEDYKHHTQQNSEVAMLNEASVSYKTGTGQYSEVDGLNKTPDKRFNIYKHHTGQYSEVVVQVADVSSGKNQATQTVDSVGADSATCTGIGLVERATSPLHAPASSVSVGVQWNLRDLGTDVPSLVQLTLQVLTRMHKHTNVTLGYNVLNYHDVDLIGPTLLMQAFPDRNAGHQPHRIRRTSPELTIAFYAALQADAHHLGHGQNVPFERVVTNVGNAYDGHVGVFRAPVGGVYVFSTTLVTFGRNNTHYAFALNGHPITYMYANGAENKWDSDSQTIILDLKTGDDVSVQHTESDKSLDGGSHCLFSGFLLSMTDEELSSIVG